jgi:acetoin utilization deacetylase AcuC-like enzyme
MKTVFSSSQLVHAPKMEIADGQLTEAVEIPQRAEIVRDEILRRKIGPIWTPQDFGRAPLERVHTPEYLTFMETFWSRWTAAGRDRDAFAYVWPVRQLRATPAPESIDGLLGRFSFDTGTPLTANTWEAATASANTALTAARFLREGDRAAFALCRPPGHHAAADYFGGYCFLNNAAIAAQWLRDQGTARVAILDIDYHHGNGTQSIFYERSDVMVLNIHADPRHDYPFFLGHADETGEKAGKGYTQNWPLPLGTDWTGYSAAFEEAYRWLGVYSPDVLIVSLGLDTYEHDPISKFRLVSDDYLRIGARLARLGKPTLFVLEGGYAVDALGINCVNVLEGFLNG